MAETSLDIEQHDQLIAYLRAAGRIGRDETPACRTLAGGVSNRTVLVTRRSGEAWVLKQALAKLRVKVDWFSDPARVHREAMGLRWLEKLAPPGTITPLVFEDAEQHLIAMSAVAQPHENWKTMLLAGRVETGHVEQFATLLATIHRRATGFDELREVFGDRSFFESLRIEPYYAYAASQVPAAKRFIDRLIADTRARRLSLVHGDYSPKNILVRDRKLILLDHEVIHWGDPTFDIGFAMTHFLSKAHHIPAFRAAFEDAVRRFMACYQAEDETMAVRQTLGCLLARVAGRSQLEYLDPAEKARQQRVAVELMSQRIESMGELVKRFVRGIDAGN
jgi:aminoglycoside phosphotransferase (APT) family kinase protein